MGNIIGLGKDSKNDELMSISNGAMDILMEVLVLSGSALAKTDDEKELIVWLAEKDQNIVGIGTVDFNISEMPWIKSEFVKQKQFMLDVIIHAEDQCGWELLGYTPNEDIFLPKLQQFKSLMDQMTEEMIEETKRIEWLKDAESTDPIKCGFPCCPKHKILMSCMGCKICSAYEC